MKQIEGRISIFEIYDGVSNDPEVPILLHEGQKIWQVNKGEIAEGVITDEYWSSSDQTNRSYRIQFPFVWGITSNKQLGATTFTNKQEAESVAASNLKKYDVILAGTYVPVKHRAWTQI